MILEVDAFEKKFSKESNEDSYVHAFIDDQTKWWNSEIMHMNAQSTHTLILKRISSQGCMY